MDKYEKTIHTYWYSFMLYLYKRKMNKNSIEIVKIYLK